MKMKRNCNLELRLFPPLFPDSDSMEGSVDDSGTLQREEHQKMTIFYNGRICVSDVTQRQASAIMMLARRGMEERSTRSPNGSGLPTPNSSTQSHHHQHQELSPPLYNTNARAFMKRSLQRFLQKRKDRIQATLPYQRD